MPKKRKQRRKRKSSPYSLTRFKYKQLYAVKLTTDGTVDLLFNLWSFSNFFSSALAGQFENLTEPLIFQRNQFDWFKPTYVKLEYTPRFNNSGVTNNLGQNNVPSYIAFDLDNVGRVTNMNALVTRDKVKRVNMLRNWSFKMKVPSVRKGGSAGIAGWNNVQTESSLTSGVLWIKSNGVWADNTGTKLPVGTNIGDIMVTYYCSFKGRQYKHTATGLEEDPTLEEVAELDGMLIHQSLNAEIVGITGATKIHDVHYQTQNPEIDNQDLVDQLPDPN